MYPWSLNSISDLQSISLVYVTLQGVGLISLVTLTQRMNARRGSSPEATGLEPCLCSVDATVTAARSARRIPRATCGWGSMWEKTAGHGTEGKGCVRGSFASPRIALQNLVNFVKTANI